MGRIVPVRVPCLVLHHGNDQIQSTGVDRVTESGLKRQTQYWIRRVKRVRTSYNFYFFDRIHYRPSPNSPLSHRAGIYSLLRRCSLARCREYERSPDKRTRSSPGALALPLFTLFGNSGKDIDEVLQSQTVYSNVSKGILEKPKDLMKAFGIDDQSKFCLEILDKGELQVAGKEREMQLASQFRDITTIVMERTIKPETLCPYTISMIGRLMRKIQFAVDPNSNSKKKVVSYSFFM
ncbi:hypothetical protein SAY87_011767 [Trapa incisa]|uniref:Uncharacterized protein n=1 Tax=Trapa incisa TaxID=236973 RepID=A0AAN7GLY8_9MYRT|nr:hypothetical protein SAY87_011767 [Trapa incisa]